MRADFAERLSALMGGFAAKRLVVMGDLMLDEFIWGRVSRISPEAPVPVVDVTGESSYPGGAANVARNVRELAGSAALIGLAGADTAGEKLLALLAGAGIGTAAIEQDPARSTTVKTRIIARNQQVVRVDRERKAPVAGGQSSRVLTRLEALIGDADGVIVADYGKGFFSQPLADAVCAVVRERGKILAVDPHPHTSLAWRGATAIKPNRAEAFLAAGMAPSEPVLPVTEDRPLLEAARRLAERSECGCLLVTLGENGMLLLERDAAPYHVPARVKDVFDVSGAGDTAIAVFTLALAAGGTAVEAAELANSAAGIVVGKLGTATVSVSELQASLAEP